jgi:2-polyprenyl-6-methoxyphenol hydroxylase-like FAD-dependent oxidoreductase
MAKRRGLKIAISGAGVAGPTLAYWLRRGGHQPTLIEAAPDLRVGGYMIDFWGVGFAVAERMGMLPAVREAGYRVGEARYVDGRGRTVGRISTATIDRELGDRFTSLPRGALSGALFRALEGQAPTLFGTRIARLAEGDEAVRVGFDNGRSASFDLVIGADGLRSNVRRLVFGPDGAFERDVGYYVAAFEAGDYPQRDPLVYVSYGYPGRQISRFLLRGGRTMFLFVFSREHLAGPDPTDLATRKLAVRNAFADAAWEWPAIEPALAAASELYFDRVSQMVLPSWSRGRTALVGDAAAAVSLLAGEGTGLGMTEAYVLAGELCATDDHAAAFAAYEARLRPFIDAKQKAARAFAGSFTPRTAFGVWARNQATRLMAIPGVPGLLIGPQMRDDFALPDYGL